MGSGGKVMIYQSGITEGAILDQLLKLLKVAKPTMVKHFALEIYEKSILEKHMYVDLNQEC